MQIKRRYRIVSKLFDPKKSIDSITCYDFLISEASQMTNLFFKQSLTRANLTAIFLDWEILIFMFISSENLLGWATKMGD